MEILLTKPQKAVRDAIMTFLAVGREVVVAGRLVSMFISDRDKKTDVLNFQSCGLQNPTPFRSQTTHTIILYY